MSTPDRSEATRGAPRVAPAWLVLGGIISVQLGAVISKGQLDAVSPVGMVVLRLAATSLLLLAIARPRLRGRARGDWGAVASLGVAIGAMNWAFYESLNRIPLGVAVAVEFVGPLALAAVTGRRRHRDLVWVVLAFAGVVLLGARPADIDLLGVGLALAAGAFWAMYILSAAATGRRWSGLDGLAVASTIAAVLVAPVGLTAAGDRLLEPQLLLAGLMVGVLSSLLPYSLEMVALRRIAPSVFGILLSLEPAVAAVMAAALLHEWLTPIEVLAVACVTVASVGAVLRQPAPRRPEPAEQRLPGRPARRTRRRSTQHPS